MIVYSGYVSFTVLGKRINIISDELQLNRNTVAEVDGKYHYLGSESPSVSAAILAWQDLNDRDLTNEEIKQVMIDNHLLSEAI